MPPKKRRLPIPNQVVAEIAVAADRTCCVCSERGKPWQLHHLDENPANNHPDNLALLCLECHDDTQVQGGFGRRLSGAQVRAYREQWYERVRFRRNKADELAAVSQSGTGRHTVQTLEVVVSDNVQVAVEESPSTELAGSLNTQSAVVAKLRNAPEELPRYLREIPSIRAKAYEAAAPPLASGVTADMMQAAYDIIDVLGRVLMNLGFFYPPDHFNPDLVRKTISSRFEWHRAHLQPNPGSHGTIVGPIASARVLADVEGMVEDMVDSLGGTIESFDYGAWLADWRLTYNDQLTALHERGPLESPSGA